MNFAYAIDRLRRERTAYQTDEKLALAANINPTNLSRFKKGKQNLSMPRITRLARVLHASIYELYLYAELADDPERLRLHDIVRSLDPHDVGTYSRVLRGAETLK